MQQEAEKESTLTDNPKPEIIVTESSDNIDKPTEKEADNGGGGNSQGINTSGGETNGSSKHATGDHNPADDKFHQAKDSHNHNNNTTNSHNTTTNNIYQTGDGKDKDPIDNYIHDFVRGKKMRSSGYKKDVNEDIKVLNEERVIILDCYDNNLLFDALHEIADHQRQNKGPSKVFQFNRGERTRTDILFRDIFDYVVQKNERLNLTILINGEVGAANLVNEVLHPDFKVAIGEYQKSLSDIHSCIIIGISRSEHIRLLNENISEDGISRRQLNFLKYKLQEIYSEDLAVQYEKIVGLRGKNGFSEEEVAFYGEIIRVLNEPEDSREDIFNSRKNFKNIDDRITTEVKDLLAGDNKLYKYVSYVAANFKNLSLDEFDFVVTALLSGEMDTPKEINQQSSLLLQPQKFSEEKRTPPESLLKKWKSNADTILYTFHLTEFDTTDLNKKVIGFEQAAFHEIFRKEFTARWRLFNRQQFHRLFFDNNFLFDEHVPAAVFENFIQIAIEAASNDPDMYCKRLLVHTTLSIVNQNAKMDIQMDPENDDYEKIIATNQKYFRKALDELEISKAFERLRWWLKKMLEHPALFNKIHEFFAILTELEYDEVVLFFVRELYTITGFNTLRWIKSLLDSRKMHVVGEAYSLLISDITPRDIAGTIEQVKSWLPSGIRPEDYQISNRLALQYPIHTSVREIISLPLQYYGNDYDRYPVFSQGGRDLPKCKEQLEFFIKQLCSDEAGAMFSVNYLGRDETGEQLNVSDAQKEIMDDLDNIAFSSFYLIMLSRSFHWIVLHIAYQHGKLFAGSNTNTFDVYANLIADIMESWFHILKGFDGKGTPEANELINYMFRVITGLYKSKPVLTKAIVRRWQEKPGVYSEYYQLLIRYRKISQQNQWEKETEVLEELIESIVKRRANMSYLFDSFYKAIKS